MFVIDSNYQLVVTVHFKSMSAHLYKTYFDLTILKHRHLPHNFLLFSSLCAHTTDGSRDGASLHPYYSEQSISRNVQAQLILCNIQTTACDYASSKNVVVVTIIQCGADEYYTQVSAPLSSTTLQHEIKG